MIKRPCGFILILALVVPAAFAQQQGKPTPPPNNGIQQRQHSMQRLGAHNAKDMELGDRQAALNALANLTKLRAKLAEAWEQMGLSPRAAHLVAAGYDPNLAAQMHHTSMRGKTDEQVAAMLRSALAANHYLVANQLLIDYQRQRLSLGEIAAGDSHQTLSGM